MDVIKSGDIELL